MWVAMHRSTFCIASRTAPRTASVDLYIAQAWSTFGVRTDNGSAAGLEALASGFLRCESDHLTEFAGLSVPTSAEELMDELDGLQIMLPCSDGWFDEMVWDQNPLLYQLVFLASLFDLLSLPLFAWRYRRRKRKLRLAVAARKAETDRLGTPQGLMKFTQSATGSSGGTCKVSPTTRTTGSSEEHGIHEHGIHLDFTALTPSPPPSPPAGSPSSVVRSSMRRPSGLARTLPPPEDQPDRLSRRASGLARTLPPPMDQPNVSHGPKFVPSGLQRRGSLDEKLTRLSNAEETQASQDDAAVMAAIKVREKAAMQTAAPSPKRLGGGLTHMQAALRREMEMDQAAAAAAAAAAGGGVEHRLAEAAEAAQAQNRLERAPRGRMSEAVKLVRQSSWLSMSGICLSSRIMHPCPAGPLGFPTMAQGEHVYSHHP